MPRAGQVVLFRFPHTDLEAGKLRLALLLGVAEFDEIVREADMDCVAGGFKVPSVIRIGRLAVVETSLLLGAIGDIASVRLERIKVRLSRWLVETPNDLSPEGGGQ